MHSFQLLSKRGSKMDNNVTCKMHPFYPVMCYSDGTVEIQSRRSTHKRITGICKGHSYAGVHIPLENGSRKYVAVHRLIAETFLNNPDQLPCVDHINRDKLDNNISNLRWVTYKTNNHNTIRQITASKDNSHVKHAEACQRYYQAKKDSGYRKTNIKTDGGIIQRWVKEN